MIMSDSEDSGSESFSSEQSEQSSESSLAASSDSDFEDTPSKKRRISGKDKTPSKKKTATTKAILKAKQKPKHPIVHDKITKQSPAAKARTQPSAPHMTSAPAPPPVPTTGSRDMPIQHSVTSSLPSGAVDITHGPPVASESAAKKLIFKYMKQQNRPYSVIQVFENLHQRITKSVVQVRL